MGSLSDILTTIQNGVVAANNLAQQTKGTLNNINGQLAAIPLSSTIPSTFVITFNGRSSAVVPAQGDYPTSLIPGTSTNNNASAGNIGEFIESTLLSSVAVVLTSGVSANVTSVSLTAGDWNVYGNVALSPGAATTMTNLAAWTSSASATIPSVLTNNGGLTVGNTAWTTGATQVLSAGNARYPLAGTTTVFLEVFASFGSSSLSAYGYIGARRMR